MPTPEEIEKYFKDLEQAELNKYADQLRQKDDPNNAMEIKGGVVLSTDPRFAQVYKNAKHDEGVLRDTAVGIGVLLEQFNGDIDAVLNHLNEDTQPETRRIPPRGSGGGYNR